MGTGARGEFSVFDFPAVNAAKTPKCNFNVHCFAQNISRLDVVGAHVPILSHLADE